MAQIFVSYSRKDKEVVGQIVQEIQDLGHECWMDTRNLQSGEPWPEGITNAILNCDKFLLFISAASITSDNVRREVQIAFDKKKNIIILRLEPVELPPVLMYPLAGLQRTDYAARDWKARVITALERQTSSTEAVSKTAYDAPGSDIKANELKAEKSPGVKPAPYAAGIFVLASIATCCIIVAGVLAYFATHRPPSADVDATQTMLAQYYTSVASTEMAQLASATVTALLTPEPVLTLTSSPAPTLTPIGPPPGYIVFDDFNTPGDLDGRWEIKDNPVECTTKSKLDGFLVLECHSSTLVKTNYQISPDKDEDQVVAGVAMLAKVDDPLRDFWGKLHLKVSLWNPNNNTSRTFLMSLRGETVYVSELGGQAESTHVEFAPGEFHLLEVNYENKQLTFLADGKAVEFDPQLTPDFVWDEWALEVHIEPQDSGVKILKSQIDWIAIKK